MQGALVYADVSLAPCSALKGTQICLRFPYEVRRPAMFRLVKPSKFKEPGNRSFRVCPIFGKPRPINRYLPNR